MRIRMGLVEEGTPGVRDIVIEVDDRATAGDVEDRVTFGQVRSRLTALLDVPSEAFSIDGHEVRDEDILGERRLVRGALLRAECDPQQGHRPGRLPLGAAGLVELHVVGGPGAGRVITLRRGHHVLGRATSCGVRLDDLGVSRAHASITLDDKGIRLYDVDSTNPTAVDGQRVPPEGAELTPGSRIRLASTTLVLRRPETTPAATECSRGVIRVNRRPRLTPTADPVTIRFPAAPTRPQPARAPVLAAVAPLVISMALAVALRSPVMLLFALMSPLMLLAQWWGDRRQGRVSHRAQLAEHARATAEAEARLAEALDAESRTRHTEQPDLALVASVATHRDACLWQRRPSDPDHLVLRLGTARQPARTRVERPEGDGPDPWVDDVPVLVDLRAGVVGVAGPRARARAVVSSLIAQTAVWHSPRTARVVVLSAAADAEADWAWASWLPHADGSASGPVATVASIHDDAAMAARIAELHGVIAERREHSTAAGLDGTQPVPAFVVVLDGAADLRGRPGLAAILEVAGAAGVHVLALDATLQRLPAECRTQLLLDGGRAPRAELRTSGTTISALIPDLPHPGWFTALARSLAPLEDATPRAGSTPLPDALSLRDAHLLHGHDPGTGPGLVELWSRSDGRPRAVLGATQNGACVVDLAQDGPHCLVGGTTGSGKSELLQTLVAGLACSAPPDELAFVLVDYKGGSAFNECSRLPHCIGVVTDLDEHLTRRALDSLGAEVKRREALLGAAGAKDLDDYRRIRSARPGLPQVARLVIVVDEFKVLADELPNFVDGLVRLAAVGRSLGVHLVLATQRPAGIITGDMRANISLRIALRVRDRSDSEDVIESPVAATISDRTPGRAWVRTASGRLTQVQTAFAGAPARPERSAAERPVTVRSLTWADLGHPWATSAPADASSGSSGSSGSTELEAVVAAAVDASATRGAVAPPPPWLPPLPTSLPRSALPAASGAGAVALGLEDAPTSQSQPPFTWHAVRDGHLAIAGGARTGRTTAARSLAVGLAEVWPATRLHLHLIEGAPGSLQDLAALPHVGSITSTADPGVAARLVARLTESLIRPVAPGRRPVASESAPRPTPDHPDRVTVVVVDGWEAVADAFDSVDHGAPVEALLRLARDGSAAGLRLVLTGGRGLLSGRISSLMQHRLVLPMPDPLDLTLAGLSPEAMQGHRVVGRAVDVATGHEVQIAHAGADPSAEAQARAAADLAARLEPGPPRDGASPDLARLPWRVAPLPHAVAWSELPEPVPGRIPLGRGGDDAAPIGFEAERDGRRVLVVGGPRSGRTTALAVMARQLTAAGHPTAVIATRPTPLSWLSGIRHLHLVSAEDGEHLRELYQLHPELSLLIDDAEGLDGSPVEPLALAVAQDVTHSEAWCVAAVDSRRAASLYRGVVPELARHGTGMVLSPSSPADGDVLGVRLDAARHRMPGRGALVLDGVAVPIQVADPTPPPRTAACAEETTDQVDTGCSPARHPGHTRSPRLDP
ncbi:FtsK/SpoIIIE domain-containing protein [Intrasporangium sp. DVR]|uniref:FtsK/SpoIIIE domain-containing protein n=1 Tax=Intrasporangium sp. DVR TaxID=3127867 RepID=UPI00313A72CC